MKYKKRNAVLFLSVAILLSVISYSSRSVISAYTAAPNIVSGDAYYIKNKNSGQYLDVDHASDSNGANVMQWKYKGTNNQKWQVSYQGNGLYKLRPLCSTTRFLDIYNANNFQRANADIWTDGSGSPARRFAIALNTDSFSYKVLSQCSSYQKVLTVEGASCSQGANVFQYTYNASKNDEWMFQPANKRAAMGVQYALANYNKRVPTYPSFGQDCANFVSQCMLASGIPFQGAWMVYKKNNTYPAPANGTQIDYSWELQTIGGILGMGASSPWISADKFKEFWTPKVKTETFNGQYILDHYSEIFGKPYIRGDVVQVLNGDKATHTMYITDYTSYGNKKSFALTYHSGDTKNKNLLYMIENTSNYKNRNFRFYKMI